MSKGALLLLTGQVGSQLLSLLRNFVVARLILPSSFGVAVTFTTTISLLNLISDIGMDKFIVQDRDGDDPRVQASLQTLIVVRGRRYRAFAVRLRSTDRRPVRRTR